MAFPGDKDLKGTQKAGFLMGKAALPAFLQPASQCGGKVCTGNLSPGLVSALPMAMTVTVGKSLPFPETQVLGYTVKDNLLRNFSGRRGPG